MNHQVKVLIGCVGVLAVACGALAVAFIMPAKEESTAEDKFFIQNETVTSVKVTNEKGTVQVRHQEDGFEVEGLQDIKLSDNAAVLIGQAEGIEASQEILNAEDLEQFGLENPAITAEIITEGNVKTLKLGHQAISSSGQYAMLNSKVYLVTSPLTAFAYGKEDYASLQVTAPLEEQDYITSVELQRKEETLKFSYVPEMPVQRSSSEEESKAQTDSGEVEQIPAYFQLISPFSAEIQKYDVTNWASAAFGLSAQSVAAIDIDESSLETFGLSEPETILKVISSMGNTIELLTSPQINGNYYIMQKGSKMIFQFSSVDVPWATVTPETLTKSVFTPVLLEQVKEISIETIENTYLLQQDNGKFLMNGQEITKEAFSTVLDAIIKIPPQPAMEVQPTLEAVAVVKITYGSERQPDQLRIIPTGAGIVYLELNGEIGYTAVEGSATALLQACEGAMQHQK